MLSIFCFKLLYYYYNNWHQLSNMGGCFVSHAARTGLLFLFQLFLRSLPFTPFPDWTHAVHEEHKRPSVNITEPNIRFAWNWSPTNDTREAKIKPKHARVLLARDWWVGGQTGRWVKGWGARTKHRNAMTRETVCDSQGLILLIALSYLIMVCLQGIFFLNIFLQEQTKKG